MPKSNLGPLARELHKSQQFWNQNFFVVFNSSHVRALINSSHNTTNKCTNVKITFYTYNVSQIWHVLVYLDHLRELLNINKVRIKTCGFLNKIKFLHIIAFYGQINVLNSPSMFLVHVILMLSNSLKMTKIDWNTYVRVTTHCVYRM